MGNDKTLEIILKAKDEASKVLSNFSKNTKTLGTTLTTIGKKVAKFGIGVAAVATGLGYAFKKIMTATTNLSIEFGESFSKMNVVFQNTQDEAKNMSDNLAKSFDLSRKSITGMIADTGDLLTGFGYTEDGALALTDQIITLGGDLASFSNISGGTEEAVTRLRKGLLGETENLKALGIVVNETLMKQKALELGYNTNIKSLTEQEKIQLRYAIAVDQSKNALGDYSRTQDSLANRQRAFSSAMEDTMMSIGIALEPVKTKILDFGASALTSFNDALPSIIDFGEELAKVAVTGEKTSESINALPEPLQRMANTMLDTTVVISGMTTNIKKFAKSVKESESVKKVLDIIKKSFSKVWVEVKKLWEALKPYTPMLKILGTIVGIFLLGAFVVFTTALQVIIILVTSFLDMMRETWEFIDTYLIQAIKTDIKNALETAGDSFEWLKDTVKSVFDSIMGFIQPAIDAISNLFGKLDGIKSKAGDILGDIGNSIGSFFGGGKATGGNVSSARSYVVGERGPEIFTPNHSGVITPNNNITNGTTININVSGNQLLDRDSGKKIAEAIFKDFKLKTNLA